VAVDANIALQEAAENHIDLPEDEPAIIILLLEYLYTSEYTPILPVPSASVPRKKATTLSIPQHMQHTFPHVCSTDCYGIVCPHHECSYDCENNCTFMICSTCCASPSFLTTFNIPAGKRGLFPHTCMRGCKQKVCAHHECGVDCQRDCESMVCTDDCAQVEARADVPEGNESQLPVHSKMYTIADKYDVPGLKQLAREKFSQATKRFWKADEFMVAAEHAYTTTMDEDEGLRAIVRDTLEKNKEMLGRPDVKTFLGKRPDLMYEILMKATR